MIENTNQTLFDIIAKGGVLMIPLILCSVIALAVSLERTFWGPRRKKIIPSDLAQDILSLLSQGKLGEVAGLCRGSDTAISRITEVALQNIKKKPGDLIRALEAAGRQESFRLQKNLNALSTIAAISPLLGLLGTVFGMIRAFLVVGNFGTGSPQELAVGIAEALITTATGLTIAIPTLIAYRYFNQKVKSLTIDLEEFALDVVNILSTLSSQNTHLSSDEKRNVRTL